MALSTESRAAVAATAPHAPSARDPTRRGIETSRARGTFDRAPRPQHAPGAGVG